MPQNSNNTNNYSEFSGYNPFSNAHIVDRLKNSRNIENKVSGDTFRTENFYRNANFILTLFLSGVALSSLVLYATVKRHNIMITQRLYDNLENTIAQNNNSLNLVGDVYKIANEMSNTTNVLGVSDPQSSTLQKNLSWEGDSNLTKGVNNNFIISKLNALDSGSQLRAIYIKKSNLYSIESATLFDLPNDWMVLPFDSKGEAEFQIKPNFEGTFLLNIFSTDDDELVNQHAAGDLGYLELSSK